MKILFDQKDNAHVIYLSGRFDSQSASKVENQLKAAIHREGNLVIVNLANVNFVDSMALTTLVKARRMAIDNGRDFYLCSLQQQVRIVFELTRLDKVFDIFTNESRALMGFVEI